MKKAIKAHDKAVNQSMAEFIANMRPLYNEVDAQEAPFEYGRKGIAVHCGENAQLMETLTVGKFIALN